MSRTTLNHMSLVLVLAAVLSLVPQSSWAGAARHPQPPAASAAARSAVGLLTQAWNHLVSVWARVGSTIDPNGTPTANNGTSSTTTSPRNVS